MILSVIYSENWSTSVEKYQCNKYGKIFINIKERVHFSDVFDVIFVLLLSKLQFWILFNLSKSLLLILCKICYQMPLFSSFPGLLGSMLILNYPNSWFNCDVIENDLNSAITFSFSNIFLWRRNVLSEFIG